MPRNAKWHSLRSYPFFFCLFLLLMLTIYDVLDLCGDETKLREWLMSYGVLREPPSDCSKCGSSLNAPFSLLMMQEHILRLLRVVGLF